MNGGLRKRTRQGTFIPRTVLRNRSLSFRARGLLAHLLDRPAGWDVRAESLARESEHDGRDKILSALRELGAGGHYRLERRQLANGQFAMGTAISEDPVQEWAADYAEYGGRAVPVVQQANGSYMVRHKDGTLTPDGFPAEHDIPEAELIVPDDAAEADGASSQVTPETGSPASAEPASAEPVPGFPEAGEPVAISNKRSSTNNREGSFRTDPPTASQYGRTDRESGNQATAEKPKPQTRQRTERTEAEQAMWDQADAIARTWWDTWRAQGVTIVGGKFPGFRQSIVFAALKAGADPDHVKRALVACGDPFPPLAKFQRHLAEIQTGKPAGGQQRQPGNIWHDPNKTTEERDRISGLFRGVTVNGERIQ